MQIIPTEPPGTDPAGIGLFQVRFLRQINVVAVTKSSQGVTKRRANQPQARHQTYQMRKSSIQLIK